MLGRVLFSLGLASGCAAESDAARYTRALSSAPDFAAAKAACAPISDPDTRGDCQVTITERFEVTELTACEHVDSDLWQHECRFLLAERIGQHGSIDDALAVCVTSRFRRHCAWHLLQDAVEESILLDAGEAERVLAGFRAVEALPDAPLQFWRIRLRERAGHDFALDERECLGRYTEGACIEAHRRHVGDVLDGLARRDAAPVCARPHGERALRRGEPVWRQGPVVAAAERRWVDARCRGLGLAPTASGSAD